MTNFFFVRHGETDFNLQKRMQGQLEIPLNEKGRLQAEKISHDLALLPVKKIYTSPLKRAVETAKIINTHLNLEIIVSLALSERYLSTHQGKTIQEAFGDVVLPKPWNQPSWLVPDDAETYDHMKDRVLSFLADLPENPDGLPLLVSHDGVFSILINELIKQSGITAENCVYYYFYQQDDTWHVEIHKHD